MFFVWMIIFSTASAHLANVALHKPTEQSPGYFKGAKSGLAVDGNKNQFFHEGRSCTHTLNLPRKKPYWEVDLGASNWIEFIRIYNRKDCCADRLRQFNITTSRDKVTFKTFTYHEDQVESVEDFYPDHQRTVGRWVKISLNYLGVLTLCEVEVMAWSTMPKALLTNVALDKPTEQSSGYFKRGKSGLAVDGNKNQLFTRGKSCTHTLRLPREKPYWEVDLGASYWIEYIRIYNRKDCCADRLRQVHITTSQDKVTFKTLTYHEDQVESVEDFYPDHPWTVGRWVKIALNYFGLLTLCEVEVMAWSTMPKVRFQTIPSARASGLLLYSFKSTDVFECLAMCRKYDECYSLEIERDPLVNQRMRCTLFDSKGYSNEDTESVQFIQVTQ